MLLKWDEMKLGYVTGKQDYTRGNQDYTRSSKFFCILGNNIYHGRGE